MKPSGPINTPIGTGCVQAEAFCQEDTSRQPMDVLVRYDMFAQLPRPLYPWLRIGLALLHRALPALDTVVIPDVEGGERDKKKLK